VILVNAILATDMSGSSRVLSAGAGVVLVVGGLLVLGGYRSGWVLGAAAAVALVVSGKAKIVRVGDSTAQKRPPQSD